IWAMHFMAMLALRIAVPVTYDPFETLLSLAVAIGVVASGLVVCTQGPRRHWRIAAAGVLIGLGVAVMHYLGMAAIRFPGTVSYRPGLWTLSLLIAIAAAIVALWLAMTLDSVRQRKVAALVMAVAVCGMHYTGMAAAVFEFDPQTAAPEGIATGPLAMAVAGIALALFLLAWGGVAADRRLLAAAAREESLHLASSASAHALRSLGADLDQQRREAEQQRTTEQLLASVFMLADCPIAIVTADGTFLMTNPSLDRFLQCAPGTLAGRRTLDFIVPACRPRIAELRRQQMVDRLSYSTDAQVLRPDGSIVMMRFFSAIAEAPDLHRFRIVTLGQPQALDEAVTPPAASATRVVVASKIRFVSLAEIRTMMGPDWAPVAETVMSLAEQALRACLQPNETFSRSTDESFVIRFADATEAHASQRAEAIQRDVHQSLLLLDQDAATVRTVVATASVTIPAAVEEAAVGAALDTCLAKAELAAPRRSRKPFEADGCRFEPVLACNKGQLIGYFVKADPTQVTAAFGKYGIAPAPLEIEAHVLAAVGRQAEQSDREGTPERFFAEVDFGNFLERAKAGSHLELYRTCGPVVRDRLVIMLTGLPAGIPVGRVHDVTARLAPFCGGIGFCLNKVEPPGFDVGLFNDPYLAFTASGLGEGVPDSRIEQVVALLHARRGRCLVRHVPSMERVRRLRTLGVDAVSLEPERDVAIQGSVPGMSAAAV
ncbi:MAG: MHYT domain-containing protein, partial [Acetobacteraceae bacterium]|nr:MHYT domain-containing protein [Acetobacteraceae bacterium]